MIPSLNNFALILFFFTTQYKPVYTFTTMPEKRNFSAYSLSTDHPIMGGDTSNNNNVNRNHKKLRRLPHVFSKVLELPFDSDTDVFIEERCDCFKFTVEDDGGVVVAGGVRAHIVEVHPGITKVVIRRKGNMSQPIVDENELDVWRYRLPSSARPELATAVYARGELVVTVPKNGWGENIRRGGGDCKGGFKGNMGNLILVQ